MEVYYGTGVSMMLPIMCYFLHGTELCSWVDHLKLTNFSWKKHIMAVLVFSLFAENKIMTLDINCKINDPNNLSGN